jgi:hypothetical protein
MRLPGTRYQEHGWEQVRKLLGQCSLQAFAHGWPQNLLDPAREGELLADYVDTLAGLLRACARSARAEAQANSYGDSVLELALSLAYELQARPGDWSAFRAAVGAEHARCGAFWDSPRGDAMLRKKVNDMYAVLRDKVDADNYQAACGRHCSPNRMYTYRMLDTAYSDIARLFGAWREHRGQVGAILGREVDAMPIEVRQMTSIGACKADWVIRWSASLERFGGGAGPLHTRSKRFASLKNSPDKIQAMLAEIGDYEELSSNRDQDWLFDAVDAGEWIDDYWRVLAESANGCAAGPDQLLAQGRDDPDSPDSPDDCAGPPPDAVPGGVDDAPAGVHDARLINIAVSLSLPPRFIELARQAQDRGSWAVRVLADMSLPVRLAAYLKLLGPCDDSYPDDWLDPATGELPTMQQLAGLDQVSLPTLRKRRDEAIARLQGAVRP